MRREIGDYIQDIIEAIDKLMKFVKGMSYDEFVQDDKTIFAVVRAIEIIGEAVKNIPDFEMRFKDWKYPDIEEGKLTKYNWLVQHKDKLKLGYKTDIGAFTYINAKNGVII